MLKKIISNGTRTNPPPTPVNPCKKLIAKAIKTTKQIDING